MNKADAAWLETLSKEEKVIAIHNLACEEKELLDAWIPGHKKDIDAALLAARATLAMIPEIEARHEPRLRDLPAAIEKCLRLAFYYGYYLGRIHRSRI